ncbi:MAG TPA: hypothetical protein DDZ80_04380 [Cyanobacteria bacterium UBA8803]|nr:hypothetical protein [Cyanobacteria bacterium UBA9273]HBL57795.1 hypothetical protein [Cyanobacteria bacterium UBA8803]
MSIKLSASIFAIIATFSSIAPVFANPLAKYDSLLNGNNLAANPQALCTDILGNQVENNKGTFSQNNTGAESNSNKESYSESHDSSKEKSGGGGLSIFGIGGSGNGKSSNTTSDKVGSNTESSTNSNWDRNLQEEYDRSTISNIAVGKNCDAFVNALNQRDQALFSATAQIEIANVNANSEVQIAGINADANKSINLEQQITNRMAVQSKEKVQLQELDTKAELAILQFLMQGW